MSYKKLAIKLSEVDRCKKKMNYFLIRKLRNQWWLIVWEETTKCFCYKLLTRILLNFKPKHILIKHDMIDWLHNCLFLFFSSFIVHSFFSYYLLSIRSYTEVIIVNSLFSHEKYTHFYNKNTTFLFQCIGAIFRYSYSCKVIYILKGKNPAYNCTNDDFGVVGDEQRSTCCCIFFWFTYNVTSDFLIVFVFYYLKDIEKKKNNNKWFIHSFWLHATAWCVSVTLSH